MQAPEHGRCTPESVQQDSQINLEVHLPPSFKSFAGFPSRPLSRRMRAAAFVAACVAAMLLLAPTSVVRADELQDVSKLVASGKLDDAEKNADAFLVKNPKDAQMRFLKGVILAQRGKRDEAATVFTGITQDYPELPEPYNNLAVIYAAQGQYEKAQGALESAIRVSPNYATAYENLGDVYAALAARSYQDARRNDANNAAALRKLNATRAMLASSSTAKPAAEPAAAPTTVPSVTEVTRSQRNVGLPSPASASVTTNGFGATAPEIIVPANATQVPPGSNVVGIEAPAGAERKGETSVLTDAKTVVGADPAQPALDVDAVTAAVDDWARSKAMTTSDLKVRIDGDTATARFRSTALTGRKSMKVDRVLTLRRDGTAWKVTRES